MGRHVFRIAAAAIAVLLIALGTIRTSGAQSDPPRILDAREPIPYFISDANKQDDHRSSDQVREDQELARWALEAWQRSAGKNLQFKAAPESSALIRLYWVEPNEKGLYGEMQPLMVGGRRGAAVFVQPNVQVFDPEIARSAEADALLRDSIVYLTCLHELGHALGLMHTRTFQDIMYYFGYGGDVVEYFGRYRAQIRSRNDIARVSGLSAADVNRIQALYSRK